ncbi:DUF6155 family protein [Nafulsella turpanensis]|uniref:DUF6155 family protein n=1 Tax=Nafulsella turpanensis TaxID=1265690 RepID=UPI00034CEBE7|nr:DUF6155 family protein [Nafulsella turpanensis]
MAKVTLKQLKRHLQELSEEELREEIIRLYQNVPLVKEYFQLELSQDSAALVSTYKQKIQRYYFPKGKSLKRPKAAKMRELIRDFQRISSFPYDVADLLLYQTECMVAFSESKGFVSTGFQQTLINRYKEALVLIKKEMLKEAFMQRCQLILKKSRFMHWDTYEQLLQLYIDNFNKEELPIHLHGPDQQKLA